MPPISLAPLSGRYLSFAEREEIAILHAQQLGVREIARRVGRSPSTISRELRRNASTRSHTAGVSGDDGAVARGAARQPPEGLPSSPRTTRCASTCRTGWPARSPGPTASWCRALMCVGSAVATVAARTGGGRDRGAPSRSRTGCRIDFPDDESMRISHEAIYQALYVQGRGALKRELVACLRTGRALRVPRARTPGARQEVRHARGHDQRAPGRGRRPRRARPLGRRPDPGARELGDRDARRAHHPVHDAAAPAPHGRPRRPSRGPRTGRRWPGTAPRPSATRSRPRSRRCPSSCADR